MAVAMTPGFRPGDSFGIWIAREVAAEQSQGRNPIPAPLATGQVGPLGELDFDRRELPATEPLTACRPSDEERGPAFVVVHARQSRLVRHSGPGARGLVQRSPRKR